MWLCLRSYFIRIEDVLMKILVKVHVDWWSTDDEEAEMRFGRDMLDTFGEW